MKSRITISPGFKKYFSNTAWLFSGRIVKMLLNFLLAAYVARYLGPERLGALNYAMSITILFSAFGSMGLENILPRELIRNPDHTPRILGSAVCLRFAGALMALGFISGFLFCTQADYATSFLTLLCALSIIFQSGDVIRSFFESQVQAKKIVWAETLQVLCCSILRIYLVWTTAPLTLFAIAWVLEWAITAGILFVLYKYQSPPPPRWRFKLETATFLVRESFPLLLSSLAIMVYMQMDKVMIKIIMGEEANAEIGFYSAALRFLTFTVFIPQLLVRSLTPSLLKAHKLNPVVYQQRIQLFNDLMTWLGFATSFVLCILAYPAILIFYGNSFSPAIPLLQITAWKGLFSAMSNASGQWIIIENLQKWAIVRNLAGAVINVVLNYYWIPLWGAVGAAWATLISITISGFLIHLAIPSCHPIFYVQCNALRNGLYRLLANRHNIIYNPGNNS